MAEKNVDIEGINYYTLLELPDCQDASAPCILLTHALMSNLHMYDSTVKALHAAGYRTLRYDHVGHHNTPPPAARTASARRLSLSGGPGPSAPTYHMDDLARHMHALVKARTGAAALHAVVGCSIGGVLALRYAMLFPADVGAVVSLAAPGIAAPAATKPLWAQRIALFEQDVATGSQQLCDATVARWLPGSAPRDAEARETALAQVRTCSLEGYRLLADAIRNYDYTAEVGRVKARTLVVAGSEDAAVQTETLRAVAESIPGARFVNMRGAGHLPPLHRPEEFEELLVGFLGKAV